MILFFAVNRSCSKFFVVSFFRHLSYSNFERFDNLRLIMNLQGNRKPINGLLLIHFILLLRLARKHNYTHPAQTLREALRCNMDKTFRGSRPNRGKYLILGQRHTSHNRFQILQQVVSCNKGILAGVYSFIKSPLSGSGITFELLSFL